LPQDAGSRAIILRSGLRHFWAGADLDIFDSARSVNRLGVPTPIGELSY
jgi:enoyl-CoA hydratase/carnithine racemase